MKTYKPSPQELPGLKDAAGLLKRSNALAAAAAKAVEAAKRQLAKWLKEQRGVELESLVVGDVVQIDNVCLIEVTGQKRFDQASFRLAQPEMFEEWEKETAVKKFKPLL